MAKSNGIKSLQQAAKLLNKHSPDGESLAYINPKEARLLKAHGGSGIMTLAGVPSYLDLGAIWENTKKYLKPLAKPVFDYFTRDQGPTPAQDQSWQTPPYNIDDRSQNINYDMWWPGKDDQQPIPFDPSQGGTNQSLAGSGGSGNFLKDLAKGAWTGIKERYSDPKNIVGDLGKAWLTVEAYKGQKDLNEFEQAKYDRALADIAAGEAEFASNIGASPLEITNMPTETDIASFTDVTLPSMTTTAVAQGGRIGFNSGGETEYEQWLIDNYDLLVSDLSWDDHSKYSKLFRDQKAQGGRIGYNMGGIDRPFQGIGALNPRMGYAQGMGPHWDVPTFSEGVEQKFPSDDLGAINVDEQTMAIISDMNDKGMDTSVISTISGVDEDTVIRYIRTLNAQAQGGRIGFNKGSKKKRNLMELLSEMEANFPGIMAVGLGIGSMGIPFLQEGGRIGAQKGGIMPLLDMGGMEKDYRQDGGFVPIGRKEKADDVPARLSKNEFVFTADAVKAAGGGDIDQGAQRMYNVMKNLEAGGQISRQSQGKR